MRGCKRLKNINSVSGNLGERQDLRTEGAQSAAPAQRIIRVLKAEAPFCNWKEYAEMMVSEARRLRELQRFASELYLSWLASRVRAAADKLSESCG
jgi:hypothetical protein